MKDLDYLFFFSSPEIEVIEIKRLNLPSSAPLSEIYQWLVVLKASSRVLKLDFSGMTEDSRTFQEGSLALDETHGELRLLGKTFPLRRTNPSEVTATSKRAIDQFLQPRMDAGSFNCRELKPSDVSYFKKWAVDQEVIRYSQTKFHLFKDEAQILDWFFSTLSDSKVYQLGMVDKETQNLVGYAGIAGINPVDQNGEYFIFIGNKDYWGRGLASEMTKLIVRQGFTQLKLHRIFLTASSQNLNALKAYHKAGFKEEGRMREAFIGIMNTQIRSSWGF